MNGNKASSDFTEELENKVNTTKQDENLRRKYMLISSFEMDAKRTGKKEVLIETIENMKHENFDNNMISKITGLSIEEIEKLESKTSSTESLN